MHGSSPKSWAISSSVISRHQIHSRRKSIRISKRSQLNFATIKRSSCLYHESLTYSPLLYVWMTNNIRIKVMMFPRNSNYWWCMHAWDTTYRLPYRPAWEHWKLISLRGSQVRLILIPPRFSIEDMYRTTIMTGYRTHDMWHVALLLRIATYSGEGILYTW